MRSQPNCIVYTEAHLRDFSEKDVMTELQRLLGALRPGWGLRHGVLALRFVAGEVIELPSKPIICLLAGHSAGSGLVSCRSQIARSLVSALEYVGKHHCGAGSCLACGGSAGIAAGLTGCEATGKGVGCPAQAVSSTAAI